MTMRNLYEFYNLLRQNMTYTRINTYFCITYMRKYLENLLIFFLFQIVRCSSRHHKDDCSADPRLAARRRNNEIVYKKLNKRQLWVYSDRAQTANGRLFNDAGRLQGCTKFVISVKRDRWMTAEWQCIATVKMTFVSFYDEL